MNMNQIIKKHSWSFFGEECMKCGMKNQCLSPSSALNDDRKYLLGLMGYRQKANEVMLKGTENHRKRQQGITELSSMGKYQFQTKLIAGETIELCEVGICSPVYGFRGYMDIVKIRLDKEKHALILEVTELKSGHNFKSYMKQLACYGLILSDPNCMFYTKIPMKKTPEYTKNVGFPLYIDKTWNKHIDFFIEIFGEPKKHYFHFMGNNQIDEKMQALSWGFKSSVKHKRRYMQPGIFYVDETMPCVWCDGTDSNCDLWSRICSKIQANMPIKDKQQYFGRKKLVVKTRPKRI